MQTLPTDATVIGEVPASALAATLAGQAGYECAVRGGR